MLTGDVYRAARRDKHGDPIGSEGMIGTIEGLILGAKAVESVNNRGHVVSTEGLVGVPTTSLLQLQHGDFLLINGSKYRIEGPSMWGLPYSLTGTRKRYCWIKAAALHN